MSSDLISALAWYLGVLAAGWLALPLAYQLFRHLPDRGFTLAKPLGLLASGFIFWLLGSLGFLHNDAPGVIFAALIVLAAGLAWLRRPGLRDLRAWLAEHGRLILALELLFLVSFAGMAIVRANNPRIEGTEKPMEFMFINSILRSPAFPPQDAWLSGHAISYYYFGYVLIAALAKVTATASGVAFNLGLALLFALTAVGAHGLVLNLIALQRQRLDGLSARQPGSLWRAYWPALLAPFLLLVVGNWYGLAQMAYVNGWFRQTNLTLPRYYFGAADPANTGLSAEQFPPPPPELDGPGVQFGPVNFWDWLDLKQTADPAPPPPIDGFNGNFGGNWFYGARVVHDRDLSGGEDEAIDEVPAFSYLLGDMHPHVLALPFGLLAAGLALEWLLWGAAGQWRLAEDSAADEDGQPLTLSLVGLRHAAFLVPFALAAVILGGLSFLNTWDFPIYLFLTLAAFILGLASRWGWPAVVAAWWRLGLLAVGLVVLSVALYFPFYLTFTSQAGGILPNLIWPTRFQQSVVFFGPALVAAAVYVAWLTARGWRSLDRRAGLAAGAGLVILLVLVVAAMVVLAAGSPSLNSFVDSKLAPLTRDEAIPLVVQRRLVDSLATIFPAVLIGLTVALGVGLLRRAPVAAMPAEIESEPVAESVLVSEPASEPEPESERETEPEPERETGLDSEGATVPARPWRRSRRPSPLAGRREAALRSPSVLMALAMILTGALLMLGPEWVYLRDNFGLRMNTIFKFYFQTWTLWAVAGAFGLWHILQAGRQLTRWLATAVLGLAMVGGLVYTFSSFQSKIRQNTNDDRAIGLAPGPRLDGIAWFAQKFPDEWAGITWLRQNVSGSPVIAEAAGGAYNIEESRFGMATGLPSVMGWTNHEGQWRGSAYSLVAERPDQLQTLYQVRDWNAAQAILDRYQIEFVIVGNLERTKYNPVYPAKFEQHMDIAFQSGTLTIYQRKPQAAQ